ncbi:MAG TPA: AAA family ATPase [Myxococcota bacterium]|nr:AAA family ATPase [Myxococcota bacterium]HRY96691.1 AAA family ATPase [Myxococcota bacterium]HSA20221.1 AAA family ATPase [Myxococcota bacterium]
MSEKSAEQRAAEFREDFERLVAEVSKVIVGYREVIEAVLACMLCDGHGLLEGVPGVGKTLLVNTLATALDLKFSRIQFTPDLMPSDVTGTTVITEAEGPGKMCMEFRRGPIFAQIVLVDEVNRATPKTQSALLEAMQEHTVSAGGTTYRLEEPFLVLATQNPLEMEGTYPLPEAQLDRFLFKILFPFPGKADLSEILARTTGVAMPKASRVLGAAELLAMRRCLREVEVAEHVRDHAIQLTLNTHPELAASPDVTRQYVRYGSSPRGAQALMLGAKLRALLDKRFAASREDVDAVVHLALRHRLVLNFEGEAAGLTTDRVVDEILKKTR